MACPLLDTRSAHSDVRCAQMLAANGARGLGPLYGGRVIAGLGIGAASNLTPLYISEISPPAIRGQLVGMYEIGWQCESSAAPSEIGGRR